MSGQTLDLRDAVHVGHSTGGGEVARYTGRHGTGRVAGAVLIGAIPPLMLKTPANPGGLPIEVFDGIRANVLADRFDVPTSFLHGDDDQIVPIDASARLAAKLVPGATLTVYAGGDHGICSTQKDRVNADLLAFLRERT